MSNEGYETKVTKNQPWLKKNLAAYQIILTSFNIYLVGRTIGHKVRVKAHDCMNAFSVSHSIAFEH